MFFTSEFWPSEVRPSAECARYPEGSLTLAEPGVQYLLALRDFWYIFFSVFTSERTLLGYFCSRVLTCLFATQAWAKWCVVKPCEIFSAPYSCHFFFFSDILFTNSIRFNSFFLISARLWFFLLYLPSVVAKVFSIRKVGWIFAFFFFLSRVIILLCLMF